jgi:hypothetical protein
VRAVLRKVGPILILAGVALIAVALVSFFGAMAGGGPPRLFWCAFVGMPVLFAGLVLTAYGYMGALARYQAGEVAPVARDAFNYMADGTKDGVRTVAGAIGEGLRGGTGTADAVLCPDCRAVNDADAKFCDACGAALLKSKACPACGEPNALDARYCDACGRAFPPTA